jgi:hypothetical protein
VTRFRLAESGWRQTIADMVNRGMPGTKEQQEAIITYLTTHRGPGAQ